MAGETAGRGLQERPHAASDEAEKDRPLDEWIPPPEPVELTPEMAASIQEKLNEHYMGRLDQPLPILGRQDAASGLSDRGGTRAGYDADSDDARSHGIGLDSGSPRGDAARAGLGHGEPGVAAGRSPSAPCPHTDDRCSCEIQSVSQRALPLRQREEVQEVLWPRIVRETEVQMPERLHSLFVCHANADRSPTAEAVFRRIAVDNGLAIEAGLVGRFSVMEQRIVMEIHPHAPAKEDSSRAIRPRHLSEKNSAGYVIGILALHQIPVCSHFNAGTESASSLSILICSELPALGSCIRLISVKTVGAIVGGSFLMSFR